MGLERWHARGDALWNDPLTFKHRCLLLAALLTLVHLARFDVAQGPIVTDVRYYVYFAARMAAGAVPHRDFFDNKTQLASAAGASLYRTATALGLDPLRTMRVGYLALTGLAALLLFAIHRNLREPHALRQPDYGACIAGLLGTLCYLGFSLLGFLPAIGPLPKLLMGVCASAAALLLYRGWWTLSGFVAAVAFLDWQIGVLAGLAVFVAALCEHERRFQRALRVAIGGLTGLALACLYFLHEGALAVAYRQVVLTSLSRGETALAGKTFTQRLAQILGTIEIACPGQGWLAVLGIVGIVLYPILLVRHRGRPTQRLVIALGVFNGGIVAFSLTDYQAYGDLFALLASLAFFAGVAANEAFFAFRAGLLRAFAGNAADRRVLSRGAAIAMLLVALVALRIGRPRLDIKLPDKIARGATSLAQQESVARKIVAATAGLQVAFVNCPEQMYLTGHANLLPVGFWNRATYSYFRQSSSERSPEALGRMLASIKPDAVLCATPRVEYDLAKSGDFDRIELHADTGAYKVVLLRRIGVTPRPPGA
jgi:hypothetical protein